MKKQLSFIMFICISTICLGQKVEPTYKNLKYGSGEFNYLNIYIAPSDKPTPVYIWAHANGKNKENPGKAEGFSPYAWEKLKAAGISAISWESIQQIQTANEFFEAEADMYKMMDWVIKNAATYNFDVHKIVVGGASRGSRISWKASQDSKYSDYIKGIFSVQYAMGDSWVLSDPRQYITPNSPDIFLTFVTHLNDEKNVHKPEGGLMIKEKYGEFGIGDKVSIYHSLPKYDALYDSITDFIWRVVDKKNISLNVEPSTKMPVTIKKLSVKENPEGIGFGFWCNKNKSKEAFLDFGRRPYERMGFFSWSNIEKSPKEYDTENIINEIKTVHKLGSTCIISLNNISGPWFNDKKGSQIPSFYPQDVNDSKTREAGQKYIYTVVKKLLKEVGEVWICFDYEMMWHCRPDTPEKQKIYHDWFLQCVKASRMAAKELNKEKDLRILPIVNGSTKDTELIKLLNSKKENHVPAQWLVDVVSVCDYLGIDSYDFDIDDPTNPQKTIETLSFWVKNYSQGKPVFITEFGYSSVNSYYPEYRTNYHASGTEEQQRDFYAAFLPAIVTANQNAEQLNGQVRSCCFWMYSDMKTPKAEAQRENHFGLIRLDGTRKPAFDVIKSSINQIENSSITATSLINKTSVINSKELQKGVEIKHVSGTEYDYIEYAFDDNGGLNRKLCIQTENGGSVLVEVDGKWYYSESEKENMHTIKIESEKSRITADIYFSGGKFPSSQIIKKIFIE